jgi:hypothetical protein
MSTNFLSTKGTKDTRNKTWCSLVFSVDKNLRGISWIAVLFVAIASGCKSTTTSTPTPQPQASNRQPQALSPLDPCPERLQDLAGALLNFMAQYNRLPPTLEDLPPIKPGAPLALTCPLTNQKYIYNPDGIKVSGNRWAVIYDPAPSHSNYRWAIVFAAPKQPGHAPVPTVIAISEPEFQAMSEFPTFSK